VAAAATVLRGGGGNAIAEAAGAATVQRGGAVNAVAVAGTLPATIGNLIANNGRVPAIQSQAAFDGGSNDAITAHRAHRAGFRHRRILTGQGDAVKLATGTRDAGHHHILRQSARSIDAIGKPAAAEEAAAVVCPAAPDMAVADGDVAPAVA